MGVSSLSPRAKVSSPSASPTSSSATSSSSSSSSSTRSRRSRTSSLERVSIRNSFVNNNSHVLSQYYNQNFLNQQNNGNDQPQTLKPNFIIPKSSSMFIESIKNHQNLLSNNLNTQVNQPMSLDSYQFQQQSSLKNDPKFKASSVRTANIVNCTNNGSPKQ